MTLLIFLDWKSAQNPRIVHRGYIYPLSKVSFASEWQRKKWSQLHILPFPSCVSLSMRVCGSKKCRYIERCAPFMQSLLCRACLNNSLFFYSFLWFRNAVQIFFYYAHLEKGVSVVAAMSVFYFSLSIHWLNSVRRAESRLVETMLVLLHGCLELHLIRYAFAHTHFSIAANPSFRTTREIYF